MVSLGLITYEKAIFAAKHAKHAKKTILKLTGFHRINKLLPYTLFDIRK